MTIKNKLRKLFRRIAGYPKIQYYETIVQGKPQSDMYVDTGARKYYIAYDRTVYDITHGKKLTIAGEYPLARENVATLIKTIAANHLSKHNPKAFEDDLALQGLLKPQPEAVRMIKTKDGPRAATKSSVPTPSHPH